MPKLKLMKSTRGKMSAGKFSGAGVAKKIRGRLPKGQTVKTQQVRINPDGTVGIVVLEKDLPAGLRKQLGIGAKNPKRAVKRKPAKRPKSRPKPKKRPAKKARKTLNRGKAKSRKSAKTKRPNRGKRNGKSYVQMGQSIPPSWQPTKGDVLYLQGEKTRIKRVSRGPNGIEVWFTRPVDGTLGMSLGNLRQAARIE